MLVVAVAAVKEMDQPVMLVLHTVRILYILAQMAVLDPYQEQVEVVLEVHGQECKVVLVAVAVVLVLPVVVEAIVHLMGMFTLVVLAVAVQEQQLQGIHT
jgi:hypothetical protein